MRYLLTIVLLLMVLVAWWATSTIRQAPQPPAQNQAPAEYPPDFGARLKRVTGIKLQRNVPAPDNLPWKTAEGQPPVGSPEARKGGTVRLSNAGPFPAHFLRFGGSVQFFHQNLKQATEIPLLARHPQTQETTAGVAMAWARVDSTIFFKLNPAAHYNNGRPVRADDYLLSLLLQAEQHCSGYESIKDLISAACSHGSDLFSITLRAGADVLDVCRMLHAAEPGFYSRFSSNFRESYAQLIAPATGPYRIADIQRGRLIVLHRVKNWWGESLPLCRHRFNADTLEFHFLTDENQVWELFLRGKLDALQTRNLTAWQERLAPHPELPTLVYDAEYPLPPYGIAANTQTLTDVHLRRGLMHAMDMDGALAVMMRGEGQRLTTFSSGYGELTPRHTPRYKYDAKAARDCFARAGFTTSGSDGILRRADGSRLSVKLLFSPHEKISNMVNFLVQSAATCGAEIVPEPVPWQNCLRQLQERSHQLVFWAVPAPPQPQPEFFFGADAAPENSPFNLTDERMSTLLEQMQCKPAHTLEQIDHRIYELAIWLPGWKENRVFLVYHPHLQIPPSPWCFDALDEHLFWVKPAP